MHDLWNLLPPGGWQRLVADVAWQSSLIIGGGLLAARLAGRRPAVRAAILLAAVILSLAVPLGSAAVRVAGVGLLAPLNRRVDLPADGPAIATRPVAGQVAAKSPITGAKRCAPVETTPIRHGRFWLLAGWAAASSLLGRQVVARPVDRTPLDRAGRAVR